MDGGAGVELSLSLWETMINTWLVMAVLAGGSWWVTRNLRVHPPLSRGQHLLEYLVRLIENQIEEISGGESRRFIPFVGTIFLFIATANLLSIIPAIGSLIPGGPAIYHPPTAAVETPVALALCVFVAVPAYSIAVHGIRRWLRGYIEPTPLMLPFNILGDISRTVSLAARLFGNMMSGTVILAILLVIAPFIFPVVMQLFGLFTGTVQAYIFAVLAMVFIASAVQVDEKRHDAGE